MFIITRTRSDISPVRVSIVNPSTIIPVIKRIDPPINIDIVVITRGDAFRDLFKNLPVRDDMMWDIKHTVAAI